MNRVNKLLSISWKCFVISPLKLTAAIVNPVQEHVTYNIVCPFYIIQNCCSKGLWIGAHVYKFMIGSCEFKGPIWV